MRLPIGPNNQLTPVLASTLGRISIEAIPPFGWTIMTVVRFYLDIADLQQRLECAPCRVIQFTVAREDHNQNIIEHTRTRIRDEIRAEDF